MTHTPERVSPKFMKNKTQHAANQEEEAISVVSLLPRLLCWLFLRFFHALETAYEIHTYCSLGQSEKQQTASLEKGRLCLWREVYSGYCRLCNINNHLQERFENTRREVAGRSVNIIFSCLKANWMPGIWIRKLIYKQIFTGLKIELVLVEVAFDRFWSIGDFFGYLTDRSIIYLQVPGGNAPCNMWKMGTRRVWKSRCHGGYFVVMISYGEEKNMCII